MYVCMYACMYVACFLRPWDGTKIYRIGLSEAPLPIERYISNFVCEVPLPPQGQVRRALGYCRALEQREDPAGRGVVDSDCHPTEHDLFCCGRSLFSPRRSFRRAAYPCRCRRLSLGVCLLSEGGVQALKAFLSSGRILRRSNLEKWKSTTLLKDLFSSLFVSSSRYTNRPVAPRIRVAAAAKWLPSRYTETLSRSSFYRRSSSSAFTFRTGLTQNTSQDGMYECRP